MSRDRVLIPPTLPLRVSRPGRPAQVGSERDQEAVPPAASGWLQAGDVVLQRFVVESLAGEGGMGAVYRGYESETGQVVAIKAIRSDHPARTARFLREVNLLARLTHPAVVRYIDHGEVTGSLMVLVMEWLEGEDLCARLSRAPLEPRESLTLMRRAAEGLAAAHRAGVVHRDIKPSNLFLVDGRADTVKVLDFGIARDHHSQLLTLSGTVLGTVGYMAPEQVRGERALGPAADVFALGCVLYECLTGRAPFAADTAAAVLFKVLTEQPAAVSTFDAGLASCDALLAKLLAKDPEDRPTDGRELLAALAALDVGQGRSAHDSLRGYGSITNDEQRFRTFVVCARDVSEAALDSTLLSDCVYDAESDLAATTRPFGGQPVQLSGETFLVTFAALGEPADAASRAARCALALRRERPELHTYVVTALAESERAAYAKVFAELRDYVERALPPSAIVLNGLAARLLESRFQVSVREGVAMLRGDRDLPVERRLLLGRATPCVGRERELAFLEATLEACMEEPVYRCVLITGAPGIGKTRLSNEWAQRGVASSGARVLVAQCEPTAVGSPFSLARKLIRRAASLRDGDPRAVQRARLRTYLEGLVGAGDEAGRLADFLGELVDPGAVRGNTLFEGARRDPGAMRNQMRRALHAWIDAESASRPLVMILEDLHWCDPQTLTLLEELHRRFAERPIMLLALARPELHERFPRSRLAWLSHHELRLSGLTKGAALKLIKAVLGESTSQALREQLVRLSEGNAFYLEELMRRVGDGATRLPETVLAMTQSRLEQLEPEARLVLRAASVFGETCRKDGVATVAQAVADVGDWLERLADEEILVSTADSRSPDEKLFQFRHALLRDAAYQMLTDRDRVAAHRAAAAWLEQAEEADPRVLAEHFAAGDLPDQARRWIVVGAEASMRLGDMEGAIDLALRGLRLDPAGEERGMLLFMQGYASAWQLELRVDELREALSLLPREGMLWWAALSTFLYVAANAGKDEEVDKHLALLISVPPPTAAAGRILGTQAMSLFALVWVLHYLGKNALVPVVLKRLGADLAGGGADPTAEAWIKVAYCCHYVWGCQGEWPLGPAIRLTTEVAESMRRMGSLSGEEVAYRAMSSALRSAGDFEGAREAAARALHLAKVSGNRLSEVWALLMSALAQPRTGRLKEALPVLRQLLSVPDRAVAATARCAVAAMAYQSGDLERAMHEAQLARASLAGRYVGSSILARIHLKLGEPAQALRLVTEGVGAGTPTSYESEAELLLTRAECELALGDRPAARSTLEQLRGLTSKVADTLDEPARRRFFTRVPTNVRAAALRREQRI